MRKYVTGVLLLTLMLSLTACGGDKTGVEKQTNSPFATTTSEQSVSPEGTTWRDSVAKSPMTAEVEYKGTTYEVHVLDSQKYIVNKSTEEIVSGTLAGDATATVLKDWIDPYGKEVLKPEDAVFKYTWGYTSERVRSLIGYCDATYTLVSRARTADYLEYIYQDKTNETHYRIAVTDDYILYAPLAFSYVFDANAY